MSIHSNSHFLPYLLTYLRTEYFILLYSRRRSSVKNIELPSLTKENDDNIGNYYSKSEDSVTQYNSNNMNYNNPKSLLSQSNDESSSVGGGTSSTIASTGISFI